jgi:hypothetical protein
MILEFPAGSHQKASQKFEAFLFFGGAFESAIHCQIWIAIYTCLLVATTEIKLKIGQSHYIFLQVISISIFEKDYLNQLICNSSSHFKDSEFSNQLIFY